MRRVFLLSIMLAASAFSALAQNYKILERSAKQQPDWLFSKETGYLTASAAGPKMEPLADICIRNIRQQTIRTISEDVEMAGKGIVSQDVVLAEVVRFIEEYRPTYIVLPEGETLISSIKVENAAEVYWERRLDRETRVESCLYGLKFYFPVAERNLIIKQFDERERRMADKYAQLVGAYDSVSSVEEVELAIEELEVLADYFFDDVRRSAAKELKTSYEELYSEIYFYEMSNTRGVYEFVSMIDERDFTMSSMPQVDAPAGVAAEVDYVDGVFVVRYDLASAKGKPIKMMFHLGSNAIEHSFICK